MLIKTDTYVISAGLASLAQRLESIEGGPTDGRVGAELAGLAECGLRLVSPILSNENETEVVVGGLHLRIEADREPQSLFGLAILLQVVQGETKILVRSFGDRQSGQLERLPIAHHRLVPAARLRQRRSQVEVGVGVHGIELDRLLEMLERHVGASELQQNHTERVAVDRRGRVDVDRLLKGSERPRRLLVVEVAEGSIVCGARLKLLNLGPLLSLFRVRAPGHENKSRHNQPKPVSS